MKVYTYVGGNAQFFGAVYIVVDETEYNVTLFDVYQKKVSVVSRQDFDSDRNSGIFEEIDDIQDNDVIKEIQQVYAQHESNN